MLKHTRRRLLIAALGLGGVMLTPGMGWAQDQNPLVIATDTLGTEVFSPLVGNAPELQFAAAIMETLVYRGRGDDLTLHPGLAESWDISPDGKVYTFHLRTVNFSDGTPFTADDVAYTFKMIGSESSHSPRKYVVDWIDKIDVVDPHTVKITLKEPQSSFLRQLANFSPYFPMISKAHFEKLGVDAANRAPLGTGSYKMTQHILSQSITLDAVPDHWRKTADFKEIKLQFVPDELTRIAMLKTGEADLAPISPASVADVKAAGLQVISNPGAYFLLVGLGGQVLPTREGYDAKSPWASQDHPEKAKLVREALCLAINTDELRQHILYGTGEPFAVQQFLPGSAFDKPQWKPYPYDPAKAKQLLAEAGYPNGFDRPITMYIVPDISPENKDLSEAVAMAWERIGLKVNRRVIDSPVWRKGWYSRSRMQDMGAYVLASTPLADPLDWYSLAADVGGSINQLFESNELSQLVKEAFAASDEKTADALRTKIGDMVYDNYMACPIALQDSLYGASKRIAGWDTDSTNKYLHNLEYIKAAD